MSIEQKPKKSEVEFKIGDLVYAAITRNGKTKEIEGQVSRVTPTRILVKSTKSSISGGSFNWSVREMWVKKNEARKTGHVSKDIAQEEGNVIFGLLRQNRGNENDDAIGKKNNG